MKKIFFSLLAIAALASCAKTEAVLTEVDSEIKLAPVTSLATKADFLTAIDGTTYPAEEEFIVKAYWNAASGGSSFTTGEVYLDEVTFTKKTNSDYWGGVTPYYWPKNGSLRFACYSPAVLASQETTLEHTLADDKWTVTGYVQPSETAKTIDFMVAPTPASYTSATADDKVAVVFEHALSWITIKVRSTEVADKVFTINDVIINNVNTKADLEAAYPDKVWSNWTEKKPYNVFVDGKQDVLAADADPDTDGVQGEVIEDTDNGTVVIPQVPTTVTINYTQNSIDSVTPVLEDQTVDVSLRLDVEKEEDNIWEPGKHYIYTIVFDLDEILINPSVADWEDVVVADKTVI